MTAETWFAARLTAWIGVMAVSVIAGIGYWQFWIVTLVAVIRIAQLWDEGKL